MEMSAGRLYYSGGGSPESGSSVVDTGFAPAPPPRPPPASIPDVFTMISAIAISSRSVSLDLADTMKESKKEACLSFKLLSIPSDGFLDGCLDCA